jgi:lysophospholipase L1-like esterase
VSRFQALVDGKETDAAIALAPGESSVVVVAGLSPGPHRIDLVKITEASVGTTVFLGFEGVETDDPPPPRKRAIEIVGDSNTAAYGVDGAGPQCHFTPATENFLHGYAWLMAQRLDADVTALAYSGKGVLQNYVRDDALTIGRLYPLANPADPETAVDPKMEREDAVVIFIGGNDVAQPNAGVFDAPDVHALAERYGELLDTVRAAHPGAPIVCVLTPSVDDTFPPGYYARKRLETAIRAAMITSGEKDAFFLAPTQADASELTGCDYHPNRALQERIAIDVAAALEHALYVKEHMK